MIHTFTSDCIDALNRHEDNSIDCIFIDPPYNTGNTKNKTPKYDRNEDYVKKNWNAFHAEWDEIEEYQAWCKEWLSVSKRKLKEKGTIFICGSFHNIPDVALTLRNLNFYTIQWVAWCIPNSFPNLSMTKMINANQTIIWARKGDSHYYDKEAAKRYNADKNLRDYWIINNKGSRWKHPSKKPVELVVRALDVAVPKKEAVIVDYFCGSGTTGVAALSLMKMYGVSWEVYLSDKEQKYIDMTDERLEEYESQDTKGQNRRRV